MAVSTEPPLVVYEKSPAERPALPALLLSGLIWDHVKGTEDFC